MVAAYANQLLFSSYLIGDLHIALSQIVFVEPDDPVEAIAKHHDRAYRSGRSREVFSPSRGYSKDLQNSAPRKEDFFPSIIYCRGHQLAEPGGGFFLFRGLILSSRPNSLVDPRYPALMPSHGDVAGALLKERAHEQQ